MNKIDKLQKQLDQINTEIHTLGKFRDTPLLKRFRRQLEGEKSVILAKISKLSKTTKDRFADMVKSNKSRSAKMQRTWRYIKAIKENYAPDKPVKEIRSALKKHRQGLETDIPDVAWRNPSP